MKPSKTLNPNRRRRFGADAFSFLGVLAGLRPKGLPLWDIQRLCGFFRHIHFPGLRKGRFAIRLGVFMLLVMSNVSGCRSQADRMAEFCLNFDAEVKASRDCKEMANRLDALLSGAQPHLNDTGLCEMTSACLPCRSAARQMLRRCGSDSDFRGVLDRMTFSKTLRRRMTSEDE